MAGAAEHLRVLRPHPNLYAFYDGRIAGQRFAPGANWVDDGALSLGIASYAIVDGNEALIYDTHISVAHARRIRAVLTASGVTRFTVLLSHWHLDHVAGTEAFADCPVIANTRTAEHLRLRRSAIEAGTDHGLPAITPLILPTEVFAGGAQLQIGRLHVELIEANIHSDDATVVWLGPQRILLAGDTLEDCVTYVGAPQEFATHLHDLDRLATLNPAVILPNHGDPGMIARGGYKPGLIRATQDYIRHLLACRSDIGLRELPLREVIAAPLAAGVLVWFPAYEAVHRNNLAATLAL